MSDPGQTVAGGLAAGARDAWAKRDRITWTLVGLVILAGVGLWLFLRVADAFAPFVIGGLIAFLLRPVITLLMKWKLGRGLAVLVTMLLLVALLVVGTLLVLPRLGAGLEQFAADLPSLKAQVQASIETIAVQLSGLPPSAKDVGQKVAAQMASTFTAAVQQIANFVLAAGGAALGFGFDAFLGLIICIWLLLGGPDIAKWCLSVLPPAWREDTAFMGRSFDRSFGGYIRGTIINMTVTFLGCAVGFSVIGLPYAMPLAMMVGLLDVIPFVGPIIAGAVCVIVGFTVSPTLGILTLVVVLIVEQAVDSVISPIVMGDSVELHPLAILLALGIGGALAGFFGVIISIPVAAALYSVYLYFMRKNGVLEPEGSKSEKPKEDRRAAEAV